MRDDDREPRSGDISNIPGVACMHFKCVTVCECCIYILMLTSQDIRECPEGHEGCCAD